MKEELKPISIKAQEFINPITNVEVIAELMSKSYKHGAEYVINQFLDLYDSARDVEERFGEGGYKLYLEILGLIRVLED